MAGTAKDYIVVWQIIHHQCDNFLGIVQAGQKTTESTETYHTFFCRTCGSGIYGETDLMLEKLSIKAGSLDDPDLGGEIDYEVYTKRRIAYPKPLEGVKLLEGMLKP
ncbi:Mss4-like protein [Penicillium frequentans]|uniref:Mss4-like protein n=1 Tax=Penicillium frequentans TaxID=3151616 RepID=A0AAD6CZZ3_9EURO|nr:Mss4-like protein [Penicillium glabrum]KAJ5557904.1 Mss4-like protein [Penicillium glabrum]